MRGLGPFLIPGLDHPDPSFRIQIIRFLYVIQPGILYITPARIRKIGFPDLRHLAFCRYLARFFFIFFILVYHTLYAMRLL